MYSQIRNLITSSFLLLYKSILKKLYGPSKNSKSNVNYNKKNNVIAVVSTEQNSVVKYTVDIMDLASPELIALLFQFALGLSSGVITNTLLKSYCLQIPNITENNCSGIIPKEIENEVQPNVSQMILIKAVIETLMPGMAILFVGPWSDSHGRRPLLLLSMAGFTISYSMWAVLAYKMYMNPLYFLLPSIPVCLSGGLTTFFLSVVCSISDITPVNKRAFKMAVFEAACMAGIFTSQLLTARVSEGPNGFTITFSISAVICFITFLYVYFLFPETVLYTQEIDHNQGFVLDVFKTCFKSRPDYGRAVLFLTICANTAYILIIFGEGSVFYLNTQKRFSWDLLDYSEFTSFGVVISGFTLYFGTWFLTSVLHLKDMTALFLVAIPRMFSSLIYGFSSNWKFLYLGVCIGCITTLITPLYRSQISKLVPLHELGKVMSFVMFVEAIVPTGATTLYTMIYNATITFFPGAIFLVSFTLSVICTTCISLCKLIQYYHPSQDFSQLPVVVDIAHSPGDEDKLVDQN